MLTLAASLFIALVINPVLTAVFIKRSNSKSKPEKKHSSEENSDIKPGSGFMSLYRRFLTLCLKYRLLTMLAVFGFVILTMLIYVKFQHGVEFFPVTTPESVMVSIKAPDGIKLDVTDALAARVEKCMSANKNIEIFVANTGVGGAGSGSTLPHRARINADFQEREKWLENPNLTIEKLRKCIDKLAGAELKIDRDKMGPPSGRPVNIEISGPDFNILSKLSQQVMEKIKGVKGLVDLSRDYNRGRPELLIRVRREEAKIVGTNTMKVAREIRTAINGSKASVFREGNDEYDIVVKLDRQFQDDYLELKRLTVPGKDGVPVPLTEVAQLTTASGSGSIRHKDTRRVVTISADVEERLPNQVLKEIKTILATFNLPAKYNLAFTGQKEEENNAKAFLKKAFLIAVLLISLVLVVQFNSILIPLVILSSVLLSIMGVLWGLLLTITPFGVMMTGMGIISLAGVVVNNAIVLIDFIIKLREKGVKKIEAIVLAGMVRLRPVLLTAITTILGLIPMATGIGIDFHQMTLQIGGRSGEWWKPMAVTVIFGLAVATVLTLVVVPVMYSLFDSLSNHFKKLVASEEDI